MTQEEMIYLSKSDAPQAKIYDYFLATPTDSYTEQPGVISINY